MQRPLIAYIIVFFLALAEQNILQHITVFGKKIELLIACLIYFSIFYKQRSSLLLSVLAGFIRDITSSNPFGINILIFTASSTLTSFLSKKTSRESLFVAIFYGFIMTFFILIGLAVFQNILTNDTINLGVYLKESVLPKSIINCLLAPVLFKILSKATK